VLDHYEIGEPEWDQKTETYKAPISHVGANKLFRAAYLGEDKYEYYEPYGGYDEGVKPENYSEVLMDQLEHLP
jgi:hypothetical protein